MSRNKFYKSIRFTEWWWDSLWIIPQLASVFFADRQLFGQIERGEYFFEIALTFGHFLSVSRQVAIDEEERCAENTKTNGDTSFRAEGTARSSAMRIRFGSWTQE